MVPTSDQNHLESLFKDFKIKCFKICVSQSNLLNHSVQEWNLGIHCCCFQSFPGNSDQASLETTAGERGKNAEIQAFPVKCSWASVGSVSSLGDFDTYQTGASQVALEVKNLPANAGDARNVGSNPGSRRFPAQGYGNPLQYSHLENPMDRGAWWATVYGVA